jgi:hypothetical protein
MDATANGSGEGAQRQVELHEILSAADSKFDDESFEESCELYGRALAEYADLMGPEDLWKDVAFDAMLSAVAVKNLETARYYFRWGNFVMSEFEGIESVYYLLTAESGTEETQ